MENIKEKTKLIAIKSAILAGILAFSVIIENIDKILDYLI
jgi:hypothetical protein